MDLLDAVLDLSAICNRCKMLTDFWAFTAKFSVGDLQQMRIAGSRRRIFGRLRRNFPSALNSNFVLDLLNKKKSQKGMGYLLIWKEKVKTL